MRIRRGIAGRLGLHRQHFLTIATVGPTPRGQLRAVVSMRGARSMLVDAHYRHVENAGVVISPGMVSDQKPDSKRRIVQSFTTCDMWRTS